MLWQQERSVSMEYFIFLSNAIAVVLEGICCAGFLFLVRYYRKKVYGWCLVLYISHLIDTLLVYMAVFLPGFEVFYNSRVDSEPVVRSTLIVIYLLSYRMILKYRLTMPLQKFEYPVIIILFCLIPLTSLFTLTTFSNFLYNSFTWVYTFYFFGAGIYVCLHDPECKHPSRCCRFLTIMLTLEILAYLETLLWIRTGESYPPVWYPVAGQHYIFTSLVGTLVDVAGLWYLALSLSQLIDHPSESQRPSEQTLHTFCQSYKLTSREEEVLFQLSDNQRIAEIAQVLYISPGTVKAHVHNIYTKTGVKNQEELRQVLSKL